MALTPEQQKQIQGLTAQVAGAKKKAQESQTVIMERADEIRTFEYHGFKFQFHKLGASDALRAMAKIPEAAKTPPDKKGGIVELTVLEEADYVEALSEALAKASAEGITMEQWQRYNGLDFPAGLLSGAFNFVTNWNQLTAEQMEALNFLREAPKVTPSASYAMKEESGPANSPAP